MAEPTDAVEQVGARSVMARGRWLVGVAVATAAVAATVAGSLLLGGDEDFPREDPSFSSVLPPMPPGATEFSISVPIEDKGKDIEILEVDARTSANVKYLGAYGIWPRDLDPEQGQPSILVGYPTGTRSQHPAFGTVVPAAELEFEPDGFGEPGDLFVQAGFQLTSGEVGGVNGLRIRYKLGNETKTSFFRWGAIVCVKPHRCGGVTDGADQPGDSDFRERTYVQLGLVSADEYAN